MEATIVTPGLVEKPEISDPVLPPAGPRHPLPRLPLVFFNHAGQIEKIAAHVDPRCGHLSRFQSDPEFRRWMSECYSDIRRPTGNLAKLAEAAIAAADSEAVRCHASHYVVSVDPLLASPAVVVGKFDMHDAREFLDEWQPQNRDRVGFVVEADLGRYHADKPKPASDDPLHDEKVALAADLSAILADDVEIEYTPDAFVTSLDDEGEIASADEDSKGNLFHMRLPITGTFDGFDTMGLDLRDGDLGPQIVAELRRVAASYTQLADDVAEKLASTGRVFVTKGGEAHA